MTAYHPYFWSPCDLYTDPADLLFQVPATVLAALVLQWDFALYRIPVPVSCCTNIDFKMISLGKGEMCFCPGILFSQRGQQSSLGMLHSASSTFGPQVTLGTMVFPYLYCKLEVRSKFNMYKNRSGKFTKFFLHSEHKKHYWIKRFFLRQFLSLSFPFSFDLSEYGSVMNQYKAEDEWI